MDLSSADILIMLTSAGLIGASSWLILRSERPAAGEQGELLNDGAVLIAEGGVISRLSEQAQALVGERVGASVSGALSRLLADEAGGAIEALNRLERTGESFRMLATTRSGQPLELCGTPMGAQIRLTLRDAALLEQRLADAEAALGRREASLAERARETQALASLLEAAPVIVWTRGPEGEIGWSGGRIRMQDSAEVTAAQVIALLAARPTEETGAEIERSRVEVQAGGRSIPLHVIERRLPDGTRTGLATDASMAASAERTLSRFVQTMTETFAHLTVGLAIFDRNKTLALFNPALSQMLQLEASKLARRPSLREILEALRTSRRIPEVENFHAWRERLMALFDDAERADYEELWHLSDGSNIRVLAKPHPHGGLAFVFDDVTERLRLEQRFRHSIELRKVTLDRMDEGLAVFGPDGVLQFVNAAFHRILHTEPGSLGVAPHANEVIAVCQAASVETDAWERMAGFITGDGARRSWTTRLTLGSGRVLSVRVAALPDGSSMIVFSDITDSERIASALRERNEALEAAEEMRTAVLDQISHRLRTPLNTIFGFAQLLGEKRFGTLTDRQRDYANGILEAAGHLLDTIDDVTELAALQIDPLHDEGTPQRVWEVLDTTVGLLQKRAMSLGARISVGEPPEDAGYMNCELPALRQIAFSMAAEALDRGGRGCKVELAARSGGDGTVLEVFTREWPGEGPGGRRSPRSPSFVQRVAAKAGGTLILTENVGDGVPGAICRFPDLLASAPAEADDFGAPRELIDEMGEDD